MKEIFTGHPKLHPQMVMFILDMMVPWVDLEGVFTVCVNVSSIPVTVQNLLIEKTNFTCAVYCRLIRLWNSL